MNVNPLSAVYGAVIGARNALYDRTLLRPRSLQGAVISVGNISTGGSGKTLRCSICHGQDLKGLANVPFIAGRSPSYLVRQLYDIKNGSRHGPWSPLMKEAVANLTLEDMVNIAAYVSSRMP